MSCPIWELPESDLEHWDLHFLCADAGCPECTAEPGEVPWIPDEGGAAPDVPED